MTRDRFANALLFLQRHKRSCLVLAGGVLALSLAGLSTLELDPSLLVMLPRGGEARRMIGFLEEVDFSGRVALSLSQPDETLSRTDFLARVDAFADSLAPPLVDKVVSRMDDRQMLGDVQFFLQQAPGLLEADDVDALAEKLTPEGVERTLRGAFLQLMKPEGAFLAEMIRRDPFDTQGPIIERLRQLAASFGYSVKLEDGHLFSADGKHLLLLLETSVPFSDGQGARELIDYLAEQGERHLAPSIAMDIVCAHRRTLGNEAVIKRDIRRTMSITGIAFVLLFLIYFKDPRAGLIFFIPFAGVLVAINLASLFLGALSPMVLGFGAVMAGISVDYGIHVYIAVRRGPHAAAAVRNIVHPLLLGALTTAAVFIAFFFTRIDGYRQLALLALVSVAVSLATALFILPLLISPAATTPPARRGGRRPRLSPRSTIGLFALLLLACVPLALRVEFDPDIARLDGPGQDVLETEKRFQAAWGGGELERAILAVSGADFESAMVINDRLYEAARREIGNETLSSLSSVWKSAERRAENARRWRHFWDAERRKSAHRLLREKGRAFGFAEDAFQPFFTRLEQPFEVAPMPPENRLFEQLLARFSLSKNDTVWLFNFFDDTPEGVAALAPLVAATPGAHLVSRRALSGILSREIGTEMSRVAAIATGLMLAVAGLMLKHLRTTLVALAPACAGVLGMLAAMGLLRVEANVINLVAAIVVVGLCIDYGVFYTCMHLRELDVGTPVAVALSAGTTLIGAGSLLFARHPALFSIGLTLVGGILAGYLATVLAVPALCRVLLEKREMS